MWADDQTNQNSVARADLHVNFKLGANSGFIGLWAPDGTNPVDLLAYGPQVSDITTGRYGEGNETFYTMPRVSPKKPNAIPGYNTPPRLPTFTNGFVTPGNQVNVYIRATDPDGDTMVHTPSPDSMLPGSSITAFGFYRWTVPTNQPYGDYLITVTATDTGVPPRSDTGSFYIYVRPAGTVTTNGVFGPRIYSVARVSNQTTFTFETIVGTTYRVFYTDDLTCSSGPRSGRTSWRPIPPPVSQTPQPCPSATTACNGRTDDSTNDSWGGRRSCRASADVFLFGHETLHSFFPGRLLCGDHCADHHRLHHQRHGTAAVHHDLGRRGNAAGASGV